jgi:hypothetical protein
MWKREWLYFYAYKINKQGKLDAKTKRRNGQKIKKNHTVLILSLSHTLFHTTHLHTRSPAHTNSHSHPLTHTRSLTPAHSRSLTLTHTRSLTHAHSHSLTHSHSHSLTLSAAAVCRAPHASAVLPRSASERRLRSIARAPAVREREREKERERKKEKEKEKEKERQRERKKEKERGRKIGRFERLRT